MSIVRALAGAALALIVGVAAALEGPSPQGEHPGAAQAQRQQTQPLNNAPVWRDVRSGAPASTSQTGREVGVLIQASGERWRELHNRVVTPAGGAIIILAVVVLAAFFFWKGPLRVREPATGRLILRFQYYERFIHWSIAILFVLLGLSGLVMLFGKHVLLPVIGGTPLGWLGQISKLVHNLAGPLFAIVALLGVINFLRDNLPSAADLQWLRAMGGMISGRHVPAGKFNAGQKLWFWIGLLLFGLIMTASGLILDFPNFNQSRFTMQAAQLVHVSVGVLFIALSLFHIYLGTIGQEGAYAAMRTGYVDEAWAKEHHELWYNDVKAGKVPQVDSGSQITPPKTASQ